jgi:Xaa-Pro aminopeptidase
MVGMIPSGRRKKVAAAVKRGGAEALLVTNLADVRYLTGFTGSSAALVLRGARCTMFTDGRYTTQARQEVDDAEIVIVVDRPAAVVACEWAIEKGISKCGFDPGTTSVAALEGWKDALPGKVRRGFFVPMAGLVAGLREVKDEIEQDRMRAAAALGCRLFDQVLEHVVPGATEMEVAMALEYMARLAGAERMSFEAIVAGGARSALPHGRATLAKIPKRGFVVLDFGVVLDGYCSDMTRTVHMGPARKGEFEAYEAVLAAQEAGVKAVKAGVTASSVDAATRGVLEAAGLAEWFTHSTGHGVGIEIHEGPRLGKLVGKMQEQQLKAGMVVTIEPGIYMPDKFGIRIEDTVLVTKDGCEILTAASPKVWMEL